MRHRVEARRRPGRAIGHAPRRVDRADLPRRGLHGYRVTLPDSFDDDTSRDRVSGAVELRDAAPLRGFPTSRRSPCSRPSCPPRPVLFAALFAGAFVAAPGCAAAPPGGPPSAELVVPTLAAEPVGDLGKSLQVGDIVFTRVGAYPFRKVAEATGTWTNHVGIVLDVSGPEPVIGESRFPFSGSTTLSRFVARSAGGRVAVMRLPTPLTPAQQAGRRRRRGPARARLLRHRIRRALAPPVLLALRARGAAAGRGRRGRPGRDVPGAAQERAAGRRRLLARLVLRQHPVAARDGDAGQRAAHARACSTVFDGTAI